MQFAVMDCSVFLTNECILGIAVLHMSVFVVMDLYGNFDNLRDAISHFF